MDNCEHCLKLKDDRTRIGFEEKPSFCRACYQSEREKTKELKALLELHRWIPVSERLPEKRGNYHVSDTESLWKHSWLPDFNCWRNDAGLLYERITHWKPIILPQRE
ncbi:hypothetical protein LCGC14_0895780 [marine sediment metagenome]|uniref:DUF551 domain-containing protein n=1 Tax=marine sediment metagenome TaxID=412755 RepID=A0A0F9RH49_9ZZZZ